MLYNYHSNLTILTIHFKCGASRHERLFALYAKKNIEERQHDSNGHLK